jgi:hypothetical protein
VNGTTISDKYAGALRFTKPKIGRLVPMVFTSPKWNVMADPGAVV